MRRIALIMLLLRHASSVAVRTALRDAVAALNHAKVPEAQASAEWLLAHALGESDRTAVQRAIASNTTSRARTLRGADRGWRSLEGVWVES